MPEIEVKASIRGKLLYLIYLAVVIFIILSAFPGGSPIQQSNVLFYAVLAIVGLGGIFATFATMKTLKHSFTLTSESSPILPKSVADSWIFKNRKIPLILGAIFGIFLLRNMFITGKAIVGAPGFGNAPSLGLFNLPQGSVLFSGIIGPIEDIFFFGTELPFLMWLFPFIGYNFNFSPLKSKWVTIPLAVLVTILSFTFYHNFIYGTNQVAITAVAFFALLGCTTTLLFGSLIFIDLIHFSNNVGVGLGFAKQIAFTVAAGGFSYYSGVDNILILAALLVVAAIGIYAFLKWKRRRK